MQTQTLGVDTTGFVLDAYIYIHRAIRSDTTNLAAASRRLNPVNPEDAAKLQKWFNFFWEMVEVHHTGEDDVVFPTIKQRVPETEYEMEVLEEDHVGLHHLVEEIEATLKKLQTVEDRVEREKSQQYLVSLTTRFEDGMKDHLSREESIVITTMARHFSPEEQHAMEKNLKKPSLKHMALLVPWIYSALNEEERATGLKLLPLPMRWLFKLSWQKKYEKFTAVFQSLV